MRFCIVVCAILCTVCIQDLALCQEKHLSDLPVEEADKARGNRNDSNLPAQLIRVLTDGDRQLVNKEFSRALQISITGDAAEFVKTTDEWSPVPGTKNAIAKDYEGLRIVLTLTRGKGRFDDAWANATKARTALLAFAPNEVDGIQVLSVGTHKSTREFEERRTYFVKDGWVAISIQSLGSEEKNLDSFAKAVLENYGEFNAISMRISE